MSDKPIGETNLEDVKKDDQKVTEEVKQQIHKECSYVMIKALYTSISGMNATQNALSVTSNNIANAQTVGYKTKAMFDDLLYNNSVGAKGDDRYAGTNPKSIGNGVKMSGTVTDYTDGTITLTGGKTQAALEGNGFFVVGDSKGGNMEFTRKGHLQYLQIIILRIQKVNMYLLIQLIHQLVMLIYLVFRDHCKFQWDQQSVVFERHKESLEETFQLMQNKLRKNCLHTMMPVIHGQCA